MLIRYPKNNDPGRPEKDEKTAELPAGAENDETCRCKSTSEMSPGELFRLMMSDLVFWKKGKTPKP